VGSDAQRKIEQEIVGERAGALGRAVETLERALAEARERLWFVVVQREALGLTQHDVLYEVLRVPLEVRRGMGPRLGPGRGPR
jgi:hypothetical protein